MDMHVKIVAWLHIILGCISLLLAGFAGLVIGMIGAIFGSAAASGGGSAVGGILGFGGAGFIAFILVAVFAIPHFLVGWGLLNRLEWARILGIVVSILSLLHPVLGVGTAIAIYSLIILFQPDTSALFRSP